MAVIKQRLYRKNASNGYDTIYLETSASSVLMANGTTVEAAVNDKASSSHTHTASQIGALPIYGGTLTGNLTIKNPNSNYGMKINLGDGDYVHFYEPTDDCLEIKARQINFVTTDTSTAGFTRNGSPIGGGSSGGVMEKVCMAPPCPTYSEAGTNKIGICVHRPDSNMVDYQSFTWNGSSWQNVNNETMSPMLYTLYYNGRDVGSIIYWWKASTYYV